MLDLIHAYETYLTKVKQASANTVCSYMRDIRQFTEWLQESEHTDILDATQLNISDSRCGGRFFLQRKRRPVTPSAAFFPTCPAPVRMLIFLHFPEKTDEKARDSATN